MKKLISGFSKFGVMAIVSLLVVGFVLATKSVFATTVESQLDLDVDETQNCSGWTVDGDATQDYYVDNSGQNRQRWHLISLTGEGSGNWDNGNSVNYDVTATWQYQESNNFGSSWFHPNGVQNIVKHGTGSVNKPGNCATPTPSPTITPTSTPTATPSASPTQSPVPSESPSPEPSSEPTPTATPTPVVRVETPLTVAGAPVCGDTAPAKIPNIFVDNAGVGKLEVRWIPTGGDKAHIFYGLEVGKPLFSLIDTPNDGVEVIGGLNSGSHYWFAVTNGSGCAWSQLSDWYDPVVE